MFAIPWTIAAVIESDGREKFNNFFRRVLAGDVDFFPKPDSIPKLEPPFPEVSTVHDFFYEVGVRLWVCLLIVIIIVNKPIM